MGNGRNEVSFCWLAFKSKTKMVVGMPVSGHSHIQTINKASSSWKDAQRKAAAFLRLKSSTGDLCGEWTGEFPS